MTGAEEPNPSTRFRTDLHFEDAMRECLTFLVVIASTPFELVMLAPRRFFKNTDFIFSCALIHVAVSEKIPIKLTMPDAEEATELKIKDEDDVDSKSVRDATQWQGIARIHGMID